ncbi:MSHA biogenesis protein MshC [Colwellia sp. MT41]|uniref:prepilin-type N-terminal cleavage/methylation domain-containing protein n=1 Tax=Colwellia sp. MT41 TaxID=58049 RepID=UPI0007179768|nr:prepilin-type N-terminal cleavage/methylation domain-containing protein [Colwellia sp. MT41]ALO36063.1 MSHA biogenesis protein MshC [Colwellia sp. MT41]
MVNSKGFTLIELIVVIILISILAVSVAPKFDGTSSYEAHTHRAQLISALRLTQQRAMQQTNTADGYCHQIVFDDVESRYGIPNRIDCTQTDPVFLPGWQADATGHTVDSRYQITFNIDGQDNPQTVGFDWMGRPTESCDGGCKINVIRPGEKSLIITIEEEGYIHVFDLP